MIRANDVVHHIPTGETWVVCGVCGDRLIPCGYPFPSLAYTSDCVLKEARTEPQTVEQREGLMKHGLYKFIEKGIDAVLGDVKYEDC